jgi:hypothetical protein
MDSLSKSNFGVAQFQFFRASGNDLPSQHPERIIQVPEQFIVIRRRLPQARE